MPIGVPRIIYCWGEELPAQWTDIYNFIFRRRMVFLMQYLDDELCNQICGLLINIHMEDRSKELEKKEMEKSSSSYSKSAGSGGLKSRSADRDLSGGAVSKSKLYSSKAGGLEDLLAAEDDLAIDQNNTLEQYTLQKITMEWLNWNAQFFDYSDEPYLYYLADILSKPSQSDFPTAEGTNKDTANLMYSPTEPYVGSEKPFNKSLQASSVGQEGNNASLQKNILNKNFLNRLIFNSRKFFKNAAFSSPLGGHKVISEVTGSAFAAPQYQNSGVLTSTATATPDTENWKAGPFRLLANFAANNYAATPYLRLRQKALNTAFSSASSAKLLKDYGVAGSFKKAVTTYAEPHSAKMAFDLDNKTGIPNPAYVEKANVQAKGLKLLNRFGQDTLSSSLAANNGLLGPEAISEAYNGYNLTAFSGFKIFTSKNSKNQSGDLSVKNTPADAALLPKNSNAIAKAGSFLTKNVLSQRRLKREYLTACANAGLENRLGPEAISGATSAGPEKLPLRRNLLNGPFNYGQNMAKSNRASGAYSSGEALNWNTLLFGQKPNTASGQDKKSSSGGLDPASLEEEYGKKVFVIINSFGGSVGNGITVHDALQFIKAGSLTLGLGVAASAASLVLAGGTIGERYVTEGCHVMIHQPEGGLNGQASDIWIDANEIMKIRLDVAEIYSLSTYRPRHKILRDLDRDFYLTATETIQYGLADEIATNDVMHSIIEMTSKVWDFHDAQQQRLLETRESASAGLDTQTQN
uniref:ATP-dependent Clp protease proteolytic subunit n=1 Tax=Chlamydomonas peterfii TaxID=28462 RepID=A0A0S2ICL0_9CHLO|nr:proteolytic subunit 2 of clp protease [Chlamydomonas peterfii]